MMQAIWNGTVIAESETTVIVEGNHYFPEASVKGDHLRHSDTTSFCGWKGDCGYYDVVVGEDVNSDAAWVYREPYPKAEKIAGHIAFWKGVKVRQA
ncbi:DUF427 domain-containing protein [Neolewinella antarctica]|uniref:Uncharacterized protein (DUF427 family) n=1 Tax=Neolewinella antarctica TaxID=442734 RepID=A0ABX0XGX7_9BACT|nr:DUF427 domain-containing protein [Neolewinella antarctica]NJC28131.1 uncharacterized protein (DUF427 family) [Neolewinella antarctica]